MALPSEVDEVRRNTDVLADDETHSYVVVEGYVDLYGIAGASAKIWQEKAARAAGLVDVTEAGASERLGQMHAAYLKQAAYWDDKMVPDEEPGDSRGRARTHAISRPSA